MATRGRIATSRIGLGEANLSEAPGGLRRFFRFSQLAVGDAGTGRKVEDIWATALRELDDLGIPAEARSRIESLGAEKFIRGDATRVADSVKALAGGKENLAAIKELQALAKAATKGLSGKELEKAIQLAFTTMEKEAVDEPGRALIRALRDAHAKNPKLLSQVGFNQATSALARRPGDTVLGNLYRKVFKAGPSTRMPEGLTEALTQAAEGKLPKVSGATARGLGKAGVKGLGLGGKLAATSTLGIAGAGLFAGFEARRAFKTLGRGARAEKQALEGFAGLGPSSSVEYLRDSVRQQEAIARRRTTLQQFEPALFQDIIRVLSDTGPRTDTLTTTERRIGSASRAGQATGGRSARDVEFLLDQFFGQLGQIRDPKVPGR